MKTGCTRLFVKAELIKKTVFPFRHKLYGITTLDDPSAVNAMYPFSLTHVGQQLGYTNWHQANQLIDQIKSQDGVNIKAADNRYHIAILAGNTMQAHKYSQAAVDLLKKVRDGEDYELDA